MESKDLADVQPHLESSQLGKSAPNTDIVLSMYAHDFIDVSDTTTLRTKHMHGPITNGYRFEPGRETRNIGFPPQDRT
jgi:hypothetical protein